MNFESLALLDCCLQKIPHSNFRYQGSNPIKEVLALKFQSFVANDKSSSAVKV